MKVLFLTSSLGNGHVRAADAIKQALIQNNSNGRDCFSSLDLWSLMDDTVASAIKDTYLRLTREFPECYQQLYDLDDDILNQLAGKKPLNPGIREFLIEQQQHWFPQLRSRVGGIGDNLDQTLLNTLILCLCANGESYSGRILPHSLLYLMRGLLLKRMQEKILTIRPDIVVATQMYPAILFTHLKANGQFSTVPCLRVATDHGAQKIWADLRADKYCVSNEEFSKNLQSWGVPTNKISVTGIPIMPKFQRVPNQADARHTLNIPLDRKTILVTGGQYGIGIVDTISTIPQVGESYHVLVAAGNLSEEMFDTLKLAQQYRAGITILNKEVDMIYPLAAADVVVGKPGGLSVSEALACGRPFYATCSLGGQEQHNIRFLSQNRIGGKVELNQLPKVLADFFQSPSHYREIQQRALQGSYRDGAIKIADIIYNLSNPDQNIPRYSDTC